MKPKRRAHRPQDLPDDELFIDRLARSESHVSAVRARGRRIEHNEGCLCVTCRAAGYGDTHV